ncbi:MAG: ATP-binding cassette domain-containing protein [Spirochaetales bacterium]|nr:ATP-binding cassette domain-containing protein [Spirochaetales bacterium]
MELDFSFHISRTPYDVDLSGYFQEDAVGIYGPSGAGKSTLLRVLAGCTQPEKGWVRLNGKTLTDCQKGVSLPLHQRKTALCFQGGKLFPHLTLRENMEFALSYALNPELNAEVMGELLGLTPLLDKKPNQVSGGENQRCAIGRAILSHPDLLLLDEPFTGLDPNLKEELLAHISKLRKTIEIPLIIISHELRELQLLTDKIYLIDKGKNIGYGTAEELVQQEVNGQFKEEFVNSFTVLPPFEKRGELYRCRIGGVNNPTLQVTTNHNMPIKVSLNPNEISLAKKKIPGISIQNQLDVKLAGIHRQGNSALCELILSEHNRIFARISRQALQDLELEKGSEAVALFKATSLQRIPS